MVDGQVGFHRPENVRKIKVAKDNARVKKIEKTRTERSDNVADFLYQAQQDRLNEIKQRKKEHMRQQQIEKKKKELEAEKEKELRSYDRLFCDESQMTSTKSQNATADSTAAEEYEDDFF